MGIHDADHNVHREFKNDWTVAVGSAALGFGNVLRSFWRFRKLWRFWAMLVVLIGIHFAVLMSLFSQMEKVPLVWGVPIAMADALMATPALHWAVMSGRRTIDGK